MPPVEVAIFDVDGVLLDSLGAHLQVCRDEARRLELGIPIPSEDEFRALVAHGAVISPMEKFFRSVGFNRQQAEAADQYYRREFSERYTVHPFPRIREMLQAISGTGVVLGIVTSNTRKNISVALGDLLLFFDQGFIFADDDMQRLTKPEALTMCAKRHESEPMSVLYIGDQPRDFEAARSAGTQFLGVPYGWGIEADDTRFPLAKSPDEIAEFIRANARARRTT